VQGLDRGIQIAMLLTQLRQLRPQFAFVVLRHRGRRLQRFIDQSGGTPGRRHGALDP
jgi:hypothetical protein